ncbi:hypothetical protein Tco_0031238 [Tanacetum coccineum]
MVVNEAWLASNEKYPQSKAKKDAKQKRKCEEKKSPGRWTRSDETKLMAGKHKRIRKQMNIPTLIANTLRSCDNSSTLKFTVLKNVFEGDYSLELLEEDQIVLGNLIERDESLVTSTVRAGISLLGTGYSIFGNEITLYRGNSCAQETFFIFEGSVKR